MENLTEFCAMDFEKIFKVVHSKNAKKTVSGSATPTSVDESF